MVLTGAQRLSLLTWSLVGAVLGGRLGYVLLYEPSYYLAHPSRILTLSEGGMASHGGFVGLFLALVVVSSVYTIRLWSVTDILVIPGGIALALGRVGNTINGEITGTLPGLPWPMYEAITDSLVACICLYFLYTKPAWPPGRLTALFVVLYSGSRLVLEVWRSPLHVLTGGIPITLEQLLTSILLLLGALLWVKIERAYAPNKKQTL